MPIGIAYSIGINPGGLGGSRPPDFGQGYRGRVVKYILSYTGSMFESGDFWREIE